MRVFNGRQSSRFDFTGIAVCWQSAYHAERAARGLEAIRRRNLWSGPQYRDVYRTLASRTYPLRSQRLDQVVNKDERSRSQIVQVLCIDDYIADVSGRRRAAYSTSLHVSHEGMVVGTVQWSRTDWPERLISLERRYMRTARHTEDATDSLGKRFHSILQVSQLLHARVSRVSTMVVTRTCLVELDVFRLVMFLDVERDVRSLGDRLGLQGQHGGRWNSGSVGRRASGLIYRTAAKGKEKSRRDGGS